MGHEGGEEGQEVDVRPTGGKQSEKDPEEWEKEVRKAGIGGAYIFSDGSLLESGNVGGGAFLLVDSRGVEVEVESGIGNVATVWDGESEAGKEIPHPGRLQSSHCRSQKGRQDGGSQIPTPAESCKHGCGDERERGGK